MSTRISKRKVHTIGRLGSPDRVIFRSGRGKGSAGTYLSVRLFGLRLTLTHGPGYSNRVYARRCP